MKKNTKVLWNQNMPPVETVRIFNQKPEQLMGANIPKSDIDITYGFFDQLD